MQLINAQLKKLFKDSIDQIVGTNGLTTKCLIRYGSLSHQLCNNCKFDPITKSSSNIYNGTGPVAFDDYQICPVCLGQGRLEHTDEDTLYLAILFDSKILDQDIRTYKYCRRKYTNYLTNIYYATT